MPHTLKYRPELIDQLISTHRIATYTHVFKPATDIELIGVYLWNKHVGAAFMPLLNAIEVATRNSIDQALTSRLGPFWWKGNVLLSNRDFGIIPPPRAGGTPEPDPKQGVIGNCKGAEKRFNNDQDDKYPVGVARPPITHGDVVSRADLSTWEYLLNHEFMDPRLLWPNALTEVFKGPLPHGRAKLNLAFAKTQFNAIRNLRNRVAHHEPVWKSFGVITEADALTSLNTQLARIENFLKMINPELHRMMEVNGFISAARRQATARAIRHAQHQLTPKKVRSLRQLAKIVGNCGLHNELQPAVMYLGPKKKFSIVPG